MYCFIPPSKAGSSAVQQETTPRWYKQQQFTVSSVSVQPGVWESNSGLFIANEGRGCNPFKAAVEGFIINKTKI